MESLTEILALHPERTRINKLGTCVGVVLLSILYAMPTYSQFADLPQDAKTVDIGVNGDGASQTFSLTAVVPLRRLNGWAGVFGSRASSEAEVLSEILKARTQGGFRIGTFGIEGFTDLERNITKGSALTSQIGTYVRPAIYEKETLRISGGIGVFLENIQPHQDLVLKKFDPTTFRWLAFSSVGWRKLNTVLKFTPEVGFKNYKFSAEPAITFSLTNRLGLRLSGSATYNSEPLTEKWHYKYLTILRVTL
ncbi:DUF481 domain-containing protein [Candidatus Poribacteria bacterium]|nr:DUF481 domain-containing protein [Candidatus Poribacteria bacterium]MYK18921.1 DUF481 domain-containing protein [Candidatus Poribacteria bacterium]